MFWGNFFENSFAQCSKEGPVFEMFLENLQSSKDAQNRSQKCPNVFWTCFGVIFLKNFFAQCSKEGRVFEMFSKNLQNSKNDQNRS